MIRFFDSFAGIGGFHIGVKQAIPDATCVGACEILSDCVELYNKNFGICPMGDIRQIDPSTIPNHDLFTGGFSKYHRSRGEYLHRLPSQLWRNKMETRECKGCKGIFELNKENFYLKFKLKNGEWAFGHFCKKCSTPEKKKERALEKQRLIDANLIKCPECGEELPATPDFFYKGGSNVFNLHGTCINCMKDAYKEKSLADVTGIVMTPMLIELEKMSTNFFGREIEYVKGCNKKSPYEMFVEQIDIKDNFDECWEWLGTIDKDGYGKKNTFLNKGVSIRMSAHRLAFTEWCGEIKKGLVIRHRCHNPKCCNPTHLMIGTNQQNMRDKGERYVKSWDLKQTAIPILKKNGFTEQDIKDLFFW